MAARTSQMKLTPELVKLCHRDVADNGEGDRYDYFRDADYDAAVEHLLANRPVSALWIFAYGSLIWKPDFEVAESRQGKLFGWHRSFCLRLTRYRGTLEQPGLMLCLDHGGSCDGLALRVPEGQESPVVNRLLQREIGSHEQLESVRWIGVQCGQDMIKALTFYAGPSALDHYAGKIPLPEVARVLARACGHWGSGAEYLYNTVKHLEDSGIHDENLWELQRLAAEEIISLQAIPL